MARCCTCNKVIVFGGVREGDRRYCNRQCASRGAAFEAALQVLGDEIPIQTLALHAGPCPKCSRPGPVDVHFSHSVWSIFILTIWRSTPHIACRRCARTRQALGAVGCFIFGWWGIPFGLILTPIQIIRNIVGILGGPDPNVPSPLLHQFVRDLLVAQYLAQVQHVPAPSASQAPVSAPASVP